MLVDDKPIQSSRRVTRMQIVGAVSRHRPETAAAALMTKWRIAGV
jgi:hypothetical protein